MNTSNKTCLLALVVAIAMTALSASAATIPAGTMLLVKTTKNIYARDHSGKPISGVLARSIVVGGKVVVPVGTTVRGVVKSPWFSVASSTRPLTLRLTELGARGHHVAIKTDDFEAENTSPWSTRRGVQVTGGAFLLPPGTLLQFHLKHPVEI
ncbi:MAG: hypothetical protein ACJ8M1_01335 [Chthoniobacterales bacterium]